MVSNFDWSKPFGYNIGLREEITHRPIATAYRLLLKLHDILFPDFGIKRLVIYVF